MAHTSGFVVGVDQLVKKVNLGLTEEIYCGKIEGRGGLGSKKNSQGTSRGERRIREQE